MFKLYNTMPEPFKGHTSLLLDAWEWLVWRLPIGATVTVPHSAHGETGYDWWHYLVSIIPQQELRWVWRYDTMTSITFPPVQVKFLRKKDAVMFALKFAE